jgi:hypothetical protein
MPQARPDTLGHTISGIEEPFWETPAAGIFPPGAYVRWEVLAFARNDATGDTLQIGVVERFHPFTIAG